MGRATRRYYKRKGKTMIDPKATSAQSGTALTDEQIEKIRDYHLGPWKPRTCAGGFPLTSEVCSACGADSNHTCGRRVTQATEDIPKLLCHITHLQSAVAEAAAVGAFYLKDIRAKLGEDYARRIEATAPSAARALMERLEAAEARARTPGTVEVCILCGKEPKDANPNCVGSPTMGRCPLRPSETDGGR